MIININDRKMEKMVEKILLEFFPEIIVEIPESPGGSCCLKPMVRQSKNSQKMYLLAQHIQWKFRDSIDLVIPSKSDSRVMPVKKYKQFKTDQRRKRLGIQKLPALVLAGKVLCEGKIPSENTLEKIVNEIIKNQ
jgi:hypothetical protein